MTNLDDLIESADSLSKRLAELINAADSLNKRLDFAASEEMRFCSEMGLKFEQLSWEMLRMGNEIKQIQSYT